MQFSQEQGLKDEEILILPQTGKGGQLTVAPGHAQPIGMEGGGGGPWRVVPDPRAVVPLPMVKLISAFLFSADKCMADAA